jgi:hypothetical protein
LWTTERGQPPADSLLAATEELTASSAAGRLPKTGEHEVSEAAIEVARSEVGTANAPRINTTNPKGGRPRTDQEIRDLAHKKRAAKLPWKQIANEVSNETGKQITVEACRGLIRMPSARSKPSKKKRVKPVSPFPPFSPSFQPDAIAGIFLLRRHHQLVSAKGAEMEFTNEKVGAEPLQKRYGNFWNPKTSLA